MNKTKTYIFLSHNSDTLCRQIRNTFAADDTQKLVLCLWKAVWKDLPRIILKIHPLEKYEHL